MHLLRCGDRFPPPKEAPILILNPFFFFFDGAGVGWGGGTGLGVGHSPHGTFRNNTVGQPGPCFITRRLCCLKARLHGAGVGTGEGTGAGAGRPPLPPFFERMLTLSDPPLFTRPESLKRYSFPLLFVTENVSTEDLVSNHSPITFSLVFIGQ